MVLTFLPGQPNNTQETVCQENWQGHTILTYCSGNNLIILTKNFENLQTIYLEKDCNCVDINRNNGFIAIGADNQVLIYKPLTSIFPREKQQKWVFCCKIFHDDSKVNCLKWSEVEGQNELVIGSTYLSLWRIDDVFGAYKPVLLWTKNQPCPVYRVDITQDSQLISSMGKYDSTVKIWKRISIGSDVSLFDLTILPHQKQTNSSEGETPVYVTSFRWKRLEDFKLESSYVLYTLTTGGNFLVWAIYNNVDNNKIIERWGSFILEPTHEFVIVLDNRVLKKAIHNTNTSDFVLTASPNAELNIYELKNLSLNPPKLMTINRIGTKKISKPSFVENPEFIYYPEPQLYENTNLLSIVVHDVHGVIRHSLLHPKELINSNTSEEIVLESGTDKGLLEVGLLKHKFTGHYKSIQKLVRSSGGDSVLSITRYKEENCLWIPQTLNGCVSLRKSKILSTESPILNAVVLEKGSIIVLLLANFKLQIWNCGENLSSKKALLTCEYELELKEEVPLVMANAPEKVHNKNRHFVVLVYKNGTTVAFKVQNFQLAPIKSDNLISNEKDEEIYLISSIDPVSHQHNSERSIFSMVTKEGLVKCFKSYFEINESQDPAWHLKWLQTSTLNTGLENVSQIRGSSIDKMACVDKSQKEFSIWDLKRGVLEYKETFSDKIKDIDWTSTPQEQSIVSIGFENYSLMYTQLRYDYTNDHPSYATLQKIDLTAYTTHPIGDSTWLCDGTFILATGNQIFIKDKILDIENDSIARQSIGSRKLKSNDLFHLCSVLNGTLPVYHPQFVVQAIFNGKINLVKEIYLRLFVQIRELEWKSKDIINLDSLLGMQFDKFTISDDSQYKFNSDEYEEPYNKFNQDLVDLLSEKLSKVPLPYVTRHQQMTLITVLDSLMEIDKLGSSIDEFGINFIVSMKLFQGHKQVQKTLTMRDVSWALHCNQKDILLSLMNGPRLTLERAKEYKLAYWIRQEDLLQKFEEIARIEFSKDDKRDPNSCMIYYLALKKKHIIIGLWKICAGHPEQRKMLNFLNNDFREERWRKAALKNAYVLLSKHRFLLAACFFLLADALKDCATVLIRQCNNLDLAIATCRVYEGDNGPVLSFILKTYVLADAIISNDRWNSSFVYWKLMQKDLSIRSLIQFPSKFKENAALIKDKCLLVNKSFLVEDPALLILYRKLKETNVKYLAGILDIEENLEYSLVQKVCEIYQRMGCDFLALDLVENWKFINKSEFLVAKNGARGDINGKSNFIFNSRTNILKPSIFDKFNMQNDTASHLHAVSYDSPSILSQYDDNNMSTSNEISDSCNTSKPRNVLDDFSEPTHNNSLNISTIPAPKSLLDDFNDVKPKPPLNGFTTNKVKLEPEKAPVANNKPRNLLDDFM
ncbi:Rav1p SCDLUD_003492 [Saccharomycodes ludwigii]|uniref:Rav1p n=1 Tax=Saccharomycodes ludwigii TaxID=36035 RepID=UPI001E82C1FC|nr:hypothetical protein SCDLUD_003492 [Saccharomycodes ludwigii]KAH3900506.1 hypothetical protein SCDLUD_003492 [Saccharomycodes ludwigii]